MDPRSPGFMGGESLSDYIRSYPSRLPGVPGILAARGTVPASDKLRLQLPVDGRAPFVATRAVIAINNVPYPQITAQLLFIEKWEWDVLQEDGRWIRDNAVKDDPHVFATPLGVTGLWGSKPLPVNVMLKPNSVPTIWLRNDIAAPKDVSVLFHGFYPRDRNPRFFQIGKMTYLEPDDPGGWPIPIGRVQLIGGEVTLDAGLDGDLIFNLGTEETAYMDSIHVNRDGIGMFDAAFLAANTNVRSIHTQMEGQSQGYGIYDGPDTNILAVLGMNGALDGILFDRSMALEPGSDMSVGLVNLDLVDPHSYYGCLTVHRM